MDNRPVDRKAEFLSKLSKKDRVAYLKERAQSALEYAARQQSGYASTPTPTPSTDIAETDAGLKMVQTVLKGAIEASGFAGAIVNDRERGKSKTGLPEGWTTVAPPANLAKAFERAGAAQLVSPEGVTYVSFAQHGVSRFEKLQQKLGFKTDRTQAAFDIGNAMAADPHVTFTGMGRGGALAKLGAEAASKNRAGGPSVDPKLCVAINANAISPKTYSAFGLSSKNHDRTTCHVVNEHDAHDRLKGFTPGGHTDDQLREAGATDAELDKRVFKIDFRNNSGRKGESRLTEDVRLTVRGKLMPDTFKKLFDQEHGETAQNKFGDKFDMPVEMRQTMVRNYVKSGTLDNPAPAKTIGTASKSR